MKKMAIDVTESIQKLSEALSNIGRVFRKVALASEDVWFNWLNAQPTWIRDYLAKDMEQARKELMKRKELYERRYARRLGAKR